MPWNTPMPVRVRLTARARWLQWCGSWRSPGGGRLRDRGRLRNGPLHWFITQNVSGNDRLDGDAQTDGRIHGAGFAQFQVEQPDQALGMGIGQARRAQYQVTGARPGAQ